MIFHLRRYGFFIAVILLQAIYFLAALHFGKICNGDTFEYVYEAVNIIERASFYCGNPVLPMQEEYLTLRTPLYPLFIAAVYTFAINNWIVLFFQNIASLFNIFFVRKTFMMLGYRSKMDVWYFLLLLFYPGQFVYADVLSPDILLQTCSVVYFYYCIRFLKEKKATLAISMSLALITGLFLKPVLYPFVVIHLVTILVFGSVKKILGLKLLSASVLPLLCVLAYSYANKVRTGKFHFSSIQSVNALYNHLCYYYDKEGFEKGEAFIAKEQKALDQLPTFKQRYDAANHRGLELLRENFSPYMQYHLMKSGRYFLQTGRGELDQFLGKLTLKEIYAGKSQTLTAIVQERKVSAVLQYVKDNKTAVFAFVTFLSNLVKLAGLFLFARYAKALPVIKWFIGLYILYFALITGPVPNAHYAMPVSLLIMCCAVTGYLYTFGRTAKALPSV